MFRLDKHAFAAAADIYESQPAFFPLVAAVLRGDQDGDVFCDEEEAPKAFYAEHSFGFAQIFGAVGRDFQEALRVHLVGKRHFRAPKVRLYTPEEPAFLRTASCESLRSERQRFVTDAAVPGAAAAVGAVEVRPLEAGDLPRLPPSLVDVTRFWRTAQDFLVRAHAVVAWCRGEAASICYAAAVAGGRAEIDVATASDFRRGGLGKAVVTAFVQKCRSAGVAPVWDCFTNNAGSMALARSCGFRPAGRPYPFYTIPR